MQRLSILPLIIFTAYNYFSTLINAGLIWCKRRPAWHHPRTYQDSCADEESVYLQYTSSSQNNQQSEPGPLFYIPTGES